MATDVEVSPSPKQIIMDTIKRPSTLGSNISSRKSNGIRDFFSAASKLSVSGTTGTSDKCEKKVHTEMIHEQDSELRKDKESNGVGNNICCEHKGHEKKKNHPVNNDTKQNGTEVSDPGVICAVEHISGKVSTGGKKRSLSTSKKAKEKKTVPSREVNDKTEEPQKDENGVSGHDKEKNGPQEMDYGEFLKTFIQTPNRDHLTVCNDKSKVQSPVLCCPKGEEVLSCSAESNITKPPPVKNKGMGPFGLKSEITSHCLTKTKVTKPSNAFSVLMQARTNKKKDKSVDDDTHEKTNDVTALGESTVETHDDSLDQPEEVPAETVCTPSVLNFFSKSTKCTKSDSDGGSSVVVEVDIHHDPTDKKITPTKKTSSSLQLKQVESLVKLSPDNDSEIVFLGSETIEIDDCDVKKRGSRKITEQLETPEKIPDTSDKGNLRKSDEDIEKKNAFLQDCTHDLSSKTAQATLQFGQGGKLAMNTSVIAKTKKKLSKKDQKKNDGSMEKKQKSSGKSPEKSDVSTKTCRSSQRLATRLTRMRNRKEQQEIVVTDSEDETSNSSQKDQAELKDLPQKTKNTKLKQKGKTTLRDSLGSETSESGTGSESKDFTPRSKSSLVDSASRSRAHELLMKARQKRDCQEKKSKCQKLNAKYKTSGAVSSTKKEKMEDKSANQVALPTPEQGTRRQSRRLAELQKAKEAAEEQICLSVDSDSSSDTSTPQKKTTRKKESSRVFSRNGSSGSSPKKPVGKLAPIFAKKTKESADSAPQQPPEDPEVLRKRREFLLSGVPSELKRQAACNTPSLITSDVAPFPECSHVQQKVSADPGSLDVWTLATPKKMAALHKEKTTVSEIWSPVLEWANLCWNQLSPARNPDSLKLLDPVSDSLDKEVQDHLIKDLQQTNPGFPFSALCDKFREQLHAGTTKQESLAVSDVPGVGKKCLDPEIVTVDEQEDPVAAQGDRDSQWPENLQPKCASEMIGNESCIRRLRYWLEEWKALIQREAKQSAKKTTTGKDSDFDYSSEDSDEEENGLCNTMLLVGPHGVGKTAAVYALAQQLAYKVFEVNASSSRQGRHILAQLQEATQSHQVAQKKDGVIVNTAPVTPSQIQSAEKNASKKTAVAVPKAFANFFKKTENCAETKTTTKSSSPKADNTKKGKGSPKTGSSRKRRKDLSVADVEILEEAPSSKKQCREKRKVQSATQLTGVKEGEESNLAGCLNLTSTSLILFDEVDLVFEEDSGFLQTVQHFINTTKIPIVMTTTDPGFKRLLSAKMETLVFTTPPFVSMTSYLQTVCLAIGMRTCYDDISALANLCGGDVRRALLTLQFLALSGGGVARESRAIMLKPTEEKTNREKNEQKEKKPAARPCDSVAGGDSDSDEDFVCVKPQRKKMHRIVDDEDGTGSTDIETAHEHKEQDSGVVIPADALPTVHQHLYESMLGVSCSLQDLLAESLKDEYGCMSVQQLTEECIKLKARKLDILQTNLLQLLPLPKTTMPGRWHPPSVPASSSSGKRKRIRSDVYDSEASDDENESATMKTVDAKGDDENADQASVSAEMLEDNQKDSMEAIEVSTDAVNEKNAMEYNSRVHVKCRQSSVEDESMEVDASSEHLASVSEAPAVASPGQRQKSKVTLKGSKTCTDHGLGSKLLSSFARYYDCLSIVDMDKGSQSHVLPCSTVRDGYILLPGIEDCASEEDGINSCERWREEMAAQFEVLSSRRFLQQVDAHVSSWKNSSSVSIPVNCSIPVLASGTTSKQDFKMTSSEMRVPEAYRSVTTAVVDKLPRHISSDAITLDYLPALRCISRAEHCRQIAKTKRRFHHHFDSIGLHLTQTTKTALCAEFPAGHQDA